MPDSLPPSWSPQDALVAVMIAESASDESITNSELMSITRIVDHMPIFADYDSSRIKQVSQVVFDLFEIEDGLDALFGIVREALPEPLYETAYAMACDVAAADGRLRQAELEFMAEIRYELNIDRLHGAAIERGARARHMPLSQAEQGG
ncbi:MAG TPA: 2-dehydro-3-deoxyphosphooctonate aldolase [Rhodobacteraceae bacterium]|nr:2-dehydro-3-deoxyphosphooctonate aldolase [Paracoccaceae bacterium]